jgi:GTP cyclohydrolase I
MGGHVPGVQDDRDFRDIPLDAVGVTDLVYPVTLPARDGDPQRTAATIGLFVTLGNEPRGAHMSRFIDVLERHPRDITPSGVRDLLTRIRDAHEAEEAGFEAECDFFVERKAPVSGAVSLMACPVSIEASLAEEFDFVLTVQVPVMTVCPCSQEATGGPAHSQRGHVSVSVRYDGRMWIEEIAEMVEDCASGPVFPLLKGDDERAIIEKAHETPVLVEDLARNVAERLDSDVRVHWYSVEAENLDSVHDHNLYAHVERAR